MRILILGAGGIGGYFGARLHEAGGDATFLVRPARAQSLRDHGLRIKSSFGDLTIQPKLVVAGESMAGFDLVLLSCKAYDLASAIDAIAPAVGSDTCVLPLLNGIAHLDALDARFGKERVLGGVALISVTLAASGEIVHLNPLHRMIAGARAPGRGESLLTSLTALAANAKLDYVTSGRIMQDLWDKFVFITTLASATCMMRAPVGTIMETGAGERFILDLLSECEQVAGENGHAVAEALTANYRTHLTQRGSKIAASMLRDIERGGPTEAQHIVGDMIARGHAAHVPVPLLEIGYAHLQSYELQRAQR
jgi:2-dehydropantoate 2-reductase